MRTQVEDDAVILLEATFREWQRGCAMRAAQYRDEDDRKQETLSLVKAATWKFAREKLTRDHEAGVPLGKTASIMLEHARHAQPQVGGLWMTDTENQLSKWCQASAWQFAARAIDPELPEVVEPLHEGDRLAQPLQVSDFPAEAVKYWPETVGRMHHDLSRWTTQDGGGHE